MQKKIISNSTRWDTFGSIHNNSEEALISKSKSPSSESNWRKRYKPSPSFLSLHLGVNRDIISKETHCHHILLEDWNKMEEEQGVVFISIPTLLDSSLSPEGTHIIHAFTPSSISEWEGLTAIDYRKKKDIASAKLITRIEKIIPGISDGICHKEIGTPKTHSRFLGRYGGTYGPIPATKLPGLLTMPLNSTGITNFFCVGDSSFPGQGLNAVAFSGFACAHKVGAELGINSWKLPD